jgi:hypothetical protein
MERLQGDVATLTQQTIMQSDNLFRCPCTLAGHLLPYAILPRSCSCEHQAVKYLQGMVRTVSYGVRANCNMNESSHNVNYIPT